MQIPLSVIERAKGAFPGSALVLVGCSVDGKRRDYCEINIISYPSVGNSKLVRLNGIMYHIHPTDEAWQILSGPFKVITDEEWKLSRIISEGKEGIKAKRVMMKRVAVSSTKFMMQAYASLEDGKVELASLYVACSVSRLSEAELLLRGLHVHPSHMASDLRKENCLSDFASAMEFDETTQTNCRRRIDRLKGFFDPGLWEVLNSKLAGLLMEKGPFECLFYSYWCMARATESKEEAAETLANTISLCAEERRVKESLKILSSLQKDILKRIDKEERLT